MSGEDPRLRFVWEEALRAIERQAASLDDVRGRAASLIGGASIAAGFLASTALADGQRFKGSTWVGCVAFAVVGLLCANVLRPRRNWKFHRSSKDLIRDYVDGGEHGPASMDDMHRDLAGHLESDYDANGNRLKRLYWQLTIGCGALVVEIGAFLLDLRGRR